MKHVFKLGGSRKSACGTDYTIKVVNNDEFYELINDGWFASLEDAMSIQSTCEEVKKPRAKKQKASE